MPNCLFLLTLRLHQLLLGEKAQFREKLITFKQVTVVQTVRNYRVHLRLAIK